MNYIKHYNQLVDRAKNRKLDCYVEIHHVIPRCMGGSDNAENLVSLTAREHFIAHLLLTKIYPGNMYLVKAVAIMCIGQSERKLTNRWYGKVRELFSVAMSEAQTGELNSQYGTQWICNSIDAKKIRIDESIPDGWVRGRKLKCSVKSKRDAKKKRYVEVYTEYYKQYTQHGFDKFVEITGYDKTLPNLVQMFKRHVEEFVPQNGKKR